MLSLTPHLLFLQLPLFQAGQLLLVTGIAFALITLICSTVRFHTMIKASGDKLNSLEDRNNFFFIQVARYLSKINRESSGFGIILVQFQSDAPDRLAIQKELSRHLQDRVRSTCDISCLFNDDCVAAILDAEEEFVPAAATRIVQELQAAVASSPDIHAIRAGVSSFPRHGLNSQLLIDTASRMLESARFNDALPLHLDPEEHSEQDGEESEESAELSKRDKNASIDPLTGVLKPEAIGSFMRKYLADIRQKKEPAASLCIGINRIDHIISLHGEDAADAVIAGVCDVFKRLTRDSDLIGRFRRTDFFILATCSLKDSELIATRLREAVQNEVILFKGKRLKTSISIGIAGHPEHGRALRHLFEGSHAALEVIRGWETSSCLVYNPAEHKPKKET